MDAALSIALLAAAIRVGGLWWLLAPQSAFMVVDGTLRLRIAVIASDQGITIRNRWRNRTVPIAPHVGLGVDERDWLFRAPFYVGMGWCPGREWEQGYVTVDGRRLWCDALISAPQDHGEDLNPTRMKIETLRRWLEAAQPR